MKISCIITTATGDPQAWPQRSAGRSNSMQKRIDLLRDDILPAAVGFDEVIVVGRIHDSVMETYPDITYLHLPPLVRDRVEAFRQREVACRWSTADIFVCSADDHKLGPDFVAVLRAKAEQEDFADIITPKRVHEKTQQELNNGKVDGYHPWHTNIIKRHVWAQLPWTYIDTLWCDVLYSDKYNDLGFRHIWDDDLVVYDVEAEAHES